ncbi:MAG: hypothetical protein AAF682_13490 [Planctomycetota bacterium]
MPGSGALEPGLLLQGCGAYGADVQVRVVAGLGGAAGALAIGPPSGGMPFVTGLLHPFPLFALEAHVLQGAPGVAGAGTIAIPLSIPAAVLAGASFALQVAYLDGGGAAGGQRWAVADVAVATRGESSQLLGYLVTQSRCGERFGKLPNSNASSRSFPLSARVKVSREDPHTSLFLASLK